MITFLGKSHAAQHLRDAAIKRKVMVTDNVSEAQVIFISEDTPTDPDGNRLLAPIHALVDQVKDLGKPIVLTSQVPPGFTRALGIKKIYHQAETLRIKDALERAFSPEYIVVGCDRYYGYENGFLPQAYKDYLDAFPCPKMMVTYEDAEYSEKIAVNMMLAAQVEATNKLSEAAGRSNVSWWHVAEVLKHDSRIGPNCYLTPGRWQDSKHLLRDYVTLEKLLAREKLLSGSINNLPAY